MYKLNPEQLQDWAEEATKIRKNIVKKSELYEVYRWPRAEVIVEDKPKSRKSVPHSTKSSNAEGLLESQIKSRQQLHAGITKKFKKRHQKELPLATREAIVKMYLVDHIFQCDIAKFYKISAALVGRLVKEAQRDPQKLLAL